MSQENGVVAWARVRPNGEVTDEYLPERCVEPVRKKCGGWMPLYGALARPRSEYREDMGPVVWWDFPHDRDEPWDHSVWVGSPLDPDWPGGYTHFTPHPPAPRRSDLIKEKKDGKS
jgi:hypothetical protein